MLETITLENAVKISAPLAKNLYEKKIKPIISGKIAKYLEKRSAKSNFEKESIKYLSWATGQCSIINTIAFPNTPKKLQDLYMPLTIVGGNEVEFIIDDGADIFEHGKKILVSDTAGMGKSTLSKKVFLNLVKEQNYVPVFIELRQLNSQPIAKQIAAKFGIEVERPSQLLSELPLVYIFDGLDEVTAKDKSLVVSEIRKFIDDLGDPRILITSRLESYLSELFDFSRFTIKPLSEREAYDLLSKYDPKGDVSRKLISAIIDSRDRDIKDFLSTPLYVSLLFCAYRHKTVIPQKKNLFYSQVYDALFESHDLSKEIGFVRQKYSNLDSSEFHFLLRRLGFWCLKNGGRIEFQKDELEIAVQDILKNTSELDTKAANFVRDLTTTVPLFLKEGNNIRWSHKSLMEYFSSMFICSDTKDKQQKILMSLYLSDNWSSYKTIFELCADIDFNPFRASVVKHVLDGYLNYHESNYKNITNKRIKDSDVEERIGLSFYQDLGFKIIGGELTLLDADELWAEDSADVTSVKARCRGNNGSISQMLVPWEAEKFFMYLIHISNRESMILKILKNKRPELFLPKNKNKREGMGFDKISVMFEDKAIKKNKLYIVSDNPKDVTNRSTCFSAINAMLSMTGAYALNVSAVQKELNNIATDSSDGIEKLIEGLF